MATARNPAKAGGHSHAGKTLAQRESKVIAAYTKELLRSKEASFEFLRSTGVINKQGKLAKAYRD